MNTFIATYYRFLLVILMSLLAISLIIGTFKWYFLTQENNLLKEKLSIALKKTEAIASLSITTPADSINIVFQHQIIKKDEKIQLLTNHSLAMLDRLRAINSYIKTGKLDTRQLAGDSLICTE